MDNAVPRFAALNINAQFDIWQPYSEEQYNAMLGTMVSQKILSRRTGTEANTISRPDECERLEIEKAEDMEQEIKKTERTKQIEEQYSKTSTTNTGSDE